MKTVEEITVDYALSLKGYEEKPGNSGFKEEWLEALFRKVGWKKYQSWCAYTTEIIWKYPYKEVLLADEVVARYDKLFSASAVQTYKNFYRAGYEVSKTPSLGALVVWQKYNNNSADWRGHIGVVTNFETNLFESIEGNTNKGKSRNGFIIWENTHNNYKALFEVRTGLRLIGFIPMQDYVFKGSNKKLRYGKTI